MRFYAGFADTRARVPAQRGAGENAAISTVRCPSSRPHRPARAGSVPAAVAMRSLWLSAAVACSALLTPAAASVAASALSVDASAGLRAAQLKWLNLQCTQITDAGCATLAATLDRGALPALGRLLLDGIPASAAAKAAVYKARANLN